MSNSLDNLIKSLKSSRLTVECPFCGEEFNLSKVVLFDGLGKFPKSAEAVKEEMLLELKERLEELKKRKISAGKGSEKKAIEVGFGKMIEKFIPAFKNLELPIYECRPLFDPIDMIVFHDIESLSVKSITFLEVKSGKSSLNRHQRLIKDAILDKRVGMRLFK